MVKHIWSVLCQKSLTDKDSNNISIIDVFERLTVTLGDDFLKQIHEKNAQKPYAFPQPFEMVNLWHFDSSTPERVADARLELIDPSGKVLSTFDYEAKIDVNQPRLRINVKIPVVSVTIGGTYWYRVLARSIGEAKYAEVAMIPLEVVVNMPKAA